MYRITKAKKRTRSARRRRWCVVLSYDEAL